MSIEAPQVAFPSAIHFRQGIVFAPNSLTLPSMTSRSRARAWLCAMPGWHRLCHGFDNERGETMEKETLDSLAALLRREREMQMREFRKAEEGLAACAEEREIEPEEHAQEEQTARYLSGLDDRALREVKEIDAALQRILDGAYGACEGCRQEIALPRLNALPATRLCAKCAAANQRIEM
jgi:RNA polymerase-binding transcription factor DksA